MCAVRMHSEEIRVDVGTVRRLLLEQFPQWESLELEQIETAGTVNAIFRVGPALAARFPLTPGDPEDVRVALIAEAAAARELAEASTVPTPRPVALGVPGAGYPMPWSVQTWLAGHDATVEDPAASVAFARDVAALIAGLRAADTQGRRFDGAGRGGDLRDHDEWIQHCFQESEDLLDVPVLRTIWADLRTLPEVDAVAMCHRDLTPPNVLVCNGRLVGLIDGGNFGPADPALDLMVGWNLLDEAPREVLRKGLGCSDNQWLRGMAWAFQQAMGLVWYYVDSNPTMSRLVMRTLDRIVSEGGR